MNTEPTKAKRTEDDFALPADFDDEPKAKRSASQPSGERALNCSGWSFDGGKHSQKHKAWQSQWQTRWHGHKHSFNTRGGGLSIQLNDGRTFNLSLGKLIFGVVLLVLLPFKLVLFAALFGAMVFFGNRGRMMGWSTGSGSADKPKRTDNNQTVTMV
ncbi:MAG: hypothetical protein MUC99_03185 [Anaerolineae bacterium]|nr:hypothetical protein [Anaerolineae bacterium]